MSYALQIRRMTPQEAALAVMQRETLRGYSSYGLLGALSPTDAANQVMPVVKNVAGFNQAVYNNLVQAATTGNFISFNPSGCGGISPSGAKIAQTAGGLALTGLTTGLQIAGVASTIAAPVTAGASLLVGLFTSIFAHHAAAVAKEQQIVCASVPAAHDSLTAIYGAVQNGTITPAQGITALQNLENSFKQTVAPILKMNSSQCNAACVWIEQLEAIVLLKSSEYQDMINAQASAALTAPAQTSTTPAQTSTTTPAGSMPAAVPAGSGISSIESFLVGPGPANIPVWGWLAGAAVLLFVVRS